MKKNTLQLTLLALFTALTLLLGLTPIGIISIPPANMTLMHIPVIIAALCFGWKFGLVIGGVFGLTSVIKLFTAPSALMSPLLGINPIIPIAISIVSRLMIPLVAYGVDRAIKKKAGLFVASAAGTLTNTILYLGLMLLAYIACGINSDTLLGIIGGVGALNGSLETALAVILCPPIVMAMRKQIA